MANVFKWVNWLMLDTLDVLKSKRALSALFNDDAQGEFEKDFAVGTTIRRKYPQRYLITDGLTYAPQGLDRRETTITMQQPFGVHFEYESFEKALYMERGEEALRREYVEPAASQIEAEIESRCALWAYQHASNVVGALHTTPTTYDATSAAARQILQENGCPNSKERGIFVPPAAMRGIKTTNIGLQNPQKDISKQFRTGYVDYADGFDWYESAYLHRHTAGTWAVPANVTYASHTANTGNIVVNCAVGDSFNKGDKFSIANVNPVHPETRRVLSTSAKTFSIISESVVATGVTQALTVTPALYGPGSQYQNIDALPVATAVLTLWPGTTTPSGLTGVVGVALHTDAFALVGLPLPMPKPGTVEISKQVTDEDSGFSIAFIRQFDGVNRKWINRLETMIGFGDYYNDSCAVAIACG